MTTWLCTGSTLGVKERQKPCLFARVNIETYEVPLYAGSSRTKKAQGLVVWCRKKSRYVRKWVKMCKDYQNSNLDIMFIKE